MLTQVEVVRLIEIINANINGGSKGIRDNNANTSGSSKINRDN